MRRVRVRASGVVQGVGYRYTARGVAQEAGVVGWVRNRRDASVEAEVEGSTDAVGAVIEWMRSGPPGSRVDALDVADIPLAGGRSFDIRDTA